MALLRDVLARFAVLVDDAPLTKLDKRIEKVKENIKKFGTYAAAGFTAAAFGAYKLVDAASDANESLNVLTQTFGANKDSVLEWSKTMSKELGRSEYTLQDSVGRFGSFLQPVFEGSNQDIATMSQKLSALAVDLASFYNTSDEEAQMRLFSGISGETEAVRRLGIDISDTSLSDLNHKRGDKRNLAQMTLQEKTVLRFEKIIQDTAKKQGDAARTGKDWANSLRRLQDRWKTLTVRLGKFLLGPATKLLHWGEKLVEALEAITLRTSTLQTLLVGAFAFAVYKAAMGLLAYQAACIKAGMAQTAINAQIGLFVGKILLAAAAFLVFEDIWTMMRGGKSVIGDLITQTTGLKRPADLVNASFEKWAINLHNAAQYMKEIYRWFPVTALPTRVIEYFATGRSGFDVGWRPNILKPKGDEDARIQNVQADAAVQKGDLQAFQNAMSGSGMDNGQIRQAFDMQRKAALFTGRARPKSEDIGEGLVEGIAYTPAGPRINNARGASGVHNGRGPIQATFNMTFGDGDPATTERAVYKALGTWHREEAAALAEQSGPQEEGGE